MQQEKFKKLYQMAVDDLTGNLLPWWMQYSVDEENGGFYGAVTNDNVPEAGHSKFITLNARLIWTFASAYRILGDENYLRYAKRAYDYFLAHFYDREHGGWYSRVDEKGAVLDDNKYIYGNAFAIYGLSEYCRATGDQEALRLAVETRDCLEKYVYDPEYKGFYESCRADWTVNPWGKGMNRSPFDVKTMNTHLHLLEAYTALCRVDNSAKTRNSLRQQLYVMLNKIVDHDIHHYFYFQDRAWKPTTPEISFGHDIEGSWLMMETAEVLGEPEAHRAARDTCVNIARACLEQGAARGRRHAHRVRPAHRPHHPGHQLVGAERGGRRLPQRLGDDGRGEVPGRLPPLLRLHQQALCRPREGRLVLHPRLCGGEAPQPLQVQRRHLPLPQRAHEL